MNANQAQATKHQSRSIIHALASHTVEYMEIFLKGGGRINLQYKRKTAFITVV